MLIFYTKQFDLLKNKIKDIIYALNYSNIFKKNKAKEKQKDKGNDTIDNENNLDDINNNEINIYKKQNKKIISNQQNKKIKNKEKQKKYSEIIRNNPFNIIRIIITIHGSNFNIKINNSSNTINYPHSSNSPDLLIFSSSSISENSFLSFSSNIKLLFLI